MRGGGEGKLRKEEERRGREARRRGGRDEERRGEERGGKEEVKGGKRYCNHYILPLIQKNTLMVTRLTFPSLFRSTESGTVLLFLLLSISSKLMEVFFSSRLWHQISSFSTLSLSLCIVPSSLNPFSVSLLNSFSLYPTLSYPSFLPSIFPLYPLF